MHSQLPDFSIYQNIDKQNGAGGRFLITMFAGLVLSLGLGIVVFVLAGPKFAFLAIGIGFVLTAAKMILELRDTGESTRELATYNKDTLEALVGMNRRATLITDLYGKYVVGNKPFQKLVGRQVWSLAELIESSDRQTLQKLLVNAQEKQIVEASFFLANKSLDGEVKFTGKRINNYLFWDLSHDSYAARIEREIAMLKTWAEPFIEKTQAGIALEDNDGKLRYLNEHLRSWLGLAEDSALPERLRFDDKDEQLITSHGGKIGVQQFIIPVQTRANENAVGNYRVIQRTGLKKNIVRQEGESEGILIDPIFDLAPVAVVIVNEEGLIREFNQPLRENFRGQKIEKNQSAMDLVHEEQRGELKKAIKEAATTYNNLPPIDVKYNVQPERVGKIYLAHVETKTGTNIILYLLDTTQEKSFERQFVQAQKMQAVGQLAGGVAHDFNNLLTAIIGFCDLLLVRHDAGDQSFSDIIQIKQNANRAANLVRQLLAFSRQQTLRPKVLMVADVLAELSNLLRRLIGERIDLKVHHGRDLKPVKVDQGQLEQVIINLVVNARDAMSNGGVLEIKTSILKPDDAIIQRYDIVNPSEYILIEVLDNGCGIPKDNLSKIFDPFFTTKSVGEGTGLGLSTVYGIVKQTGGYVFVESEVGKGTRFQLLLKVHEEEPAAKIENAVEEKSESAKDLTGKGTILIVEDEDPVRMFAARALENKGYTVLQADCGESGLEVVNAHEGDIELLITDVVMPNMDGPALVTEARKSRPSMNVIFISGYAEDMLRKDLEAEQFHFLPKPFSLQKLAETVKLILD